MLIKSVLSLVMSSQSLLITFSYPPKIRVQNTLLEDHVWTEIEGVPVFAGVPPWNPMHDLLVDRRTQTLAGIVYPVAEGEHAAVAAICGFLPKDVVRYCISPVSAAALLRNFETELSDGLNIAGDLNVSVNVNSPARRLMFRFKAPIYTDTKKSSMSFMKEIVA